MLEENQNHQEENVFEEPEEVLDQEQQEIRKKILEALDPEDLPL